MQEIIVAARDAQVSELGPLQELRDVVKQLRIVTLEQHDTAVALLKGAKAKWSQLEARRKEITAPLLAAKKSADDLFRPVLEVCVDIEDALKTEIATYRRRAEAARVEAMTTRAAVDAPPEAQGVTVRVERRFRVVDEALVPREFCSPDLRKISTQPTDTAIPGIEWYDHEIVRAGK